MTAVVSLADLPSTGCVSDVVAPRIPVGDRPGAASLEDAYGVLADLRAQAGTVVCVYPAWQAQPAERLIRFTRVAMGTTDVVGVASNLPPVALSLTVDLLAYLVTYVPAGILVTMAERLESMLVTGAWLSSVTRLQHVPVKVGDHVRSYLPGARFAAVVSPKQLLLRPATGAQLPFNPGDPVHLVTSPSGTPAASKAGDTWVREGLTPTLRPAVTRSLPAAPLAAAYWGTKHFVEFAAFSGHPEYLGRAVRSIRYRPCSWCGELVNSDPCPLCQMSASGAGFVPSRTLPSGSVPATAPHVGAAPGQGAPQLERSDAP